jgi:hypothetical protein
MKAIKEPVLTGIAFILVFGFLGWLGDVIGLWVVFIGLMVGFVVWAQRDMNRPFRRSEERPLAASAPGAVDAQDGPTGRR